MRIKASALFLTGILFIFFGLFANSRIKQNNTLQTSNNSAITTNVQKPARGKEILVVKILDGDTIETKEGEKIRYIGINAPETGQPKSKEATDFNNKMVLGKSISLEFDVQTKDRYGRSLAYVFINKTLINEDLVKNGLAVSETIQPNVKYQNKILEAQKKARESCVGIWGGLCIDPKNVLGKKENCVKIISIKADAPGDDNKNKNGEWIEIKNNCLANVNMKGWLIKDNSASNKYEFKDYNLESEKIVYIYSGCGQNAQNKLYWQCPEGKYSIWNNSGDNAFLYNEKGEMISNYEY
ncbi:hypothetical protein C4559_03150 [Candidatus Microgenomates bacterium]|nr:MAG: hypothetical protein C4559_03150 [Candidatus Microgenomates bacterium]